MELVHLGRQEPKLQKPLRHLFMVKKRSSKVCTFWTAIDGG